MSSKSATSLRTAIKDDLGKLDKEQTSYHNILDSFRLALKGINLVKKRSGLNKLVIPIFLAILISLFSTQSLVKAEIKITPPLNWQPDPNNNLTIMKWSQNSTGSVFGIAQMPDSLAFPLLLMGPGMGQFFAEKGILESVDQLAFGQSNFGYIYFLDLSTPFKLNSSGLAAAGGYFSGIPKTIDVPYKGMVIFTEKQGDLYGILFFSPLEGFDSKLNAIKPTLDSIQLSNSTGSP